MMPMMPKISVRPDATRNSSSPYWTPFRSWIASEYTSIEPRPPKTSAGRHNACPRRILQRSLKLAAARRIGQVLDRDAYDLVLLAFDLAQVDVVDRVVALVQRKRPTRAIDFRPLHRLHDLSAFGGVALDRIHARDEELCRVVALDRVDVRLAFVRLHVRGSKGVVLRIAESVAVVQCRQQTLCRV